MEYTKYSYNDGGCNDHSPCLSSIELHVAMQWSAFLDSELRACKMRSSRPWPGGSKKTNKKKKTSSSSSTKGKTVDGDDDDDDHHNNNDDNCYEEDNEDSKQHHKAANNFFVNLELSRFDLNHQKVGQALLEARSDFLKKQMGQHQWWSALVNSTQQGKEMSVRHLVRFCAETVLPLSFACSPTPVRRVNVCTSSGSSTPIVCTIMEEAKTDKEWFFYAYTAVPTKTRLVCDAILKANNAYLLNFAAATAAANAAAAAAVAANASLQNHNHNTVTEQQLTIITGQDPHQLLVGACYVDDTQYRHVKRHSFAKIQHFRFFCLQQLEKWQTALWIQEEETMKAAQEEQKLQVDSDHDNNNNDEDLQYADFDMDLEDLADAASGFMPIPTSTATTVASS